MTIHLDDHETLYENKIPLDANHAISIEIYTKSFPTSMTASRYKKSFCYVDWVYQQNTDTASTNDNRYVYILYT